MKRTTFFRFGGGALIIIGAFFLGMLFYGMQSVWVDFSVLEQYNPGSPSLLLDIHGNEWGRFQLEKREPITIEQMPQHLVDAFVAAEDWCFFSHYGISWRGIARSLLVNLYAGRIVQGASTITQQLVKLLFLDSNRTFSRKVKEQFCALLVEQQFTKNQILQTYLNHVYFGCGIYGVEAASQKFWGKPAAELLIEEAAVLAGIVRSPGNYCPLLCPLSSEKRRNVVLRKMAKLGFLDEKQRDVLIAQPLQVRSIVTQQHAPHLKETLRLFLEERFGKDMLYTGGLTIQTTLDLTVQKTAEEVFKKRVEQLRNDLLPDIDGGLISLDVVTGGIRAMIGGYNFSDSKFNRATQGYRQIGSVFKPLIYACAIQQGRSFADTEIDEPLEMEMPNGSCWMPNNFNLKFDGEVTLAYGLYRSSNIIAIKTLLDVGYDPVIDLAKKCRIAGPFNAYPSLALGCVDSSLSDVAGMFNIFANAGEYVEPHALLWVKDRWGSKIYRTLSEREQVLDSVTTSYVAKVLTLSLKRIRKWFGPKWLSSEAISKTGTTNDCRTCWYAGSTPELTTVVYIGTDDNRSMGKSVYPLRTSFPIWLGLNTKLTPSKKQFNFDRTLDEQIIHEKTGKRLSSMKHENAIQIFV